MKQLALLLCLALVTRVSSGADDDDDSPTQVLQHSREEARGPSSLICSTCDDGNGSSPSIAAQSVDVGDDDEEEEEEDEGEDAQDPGEDPASFGSVGETGKPGRPGRSGENGSPATPQDFVEFSTSRAQDLAPSECKSIGDVMRERGLTSFLALVDAAGLAAVFNDPETILTVFVPTNSAVESFMEDPEVGAESVLSFEAASSLVFYHIVPKIRYWNMLIDGRILSSLLDKSSSPCGINELVCGDYPAPADENREDTTSTRKLIYGGAATAEINGFDVMACRSVIHVIDTILLPCSYQLLVPSEG